jgi:PAS domain S-box-containing protein
MSTADPDLVREAEDLRIAISRGEIDAFVVGRDDGRRVLLLANAYQRYRQLVERMQEGAVTVSMEGRLLYANQRFADMLGMPLSQLYTAPLDSFVSMGDRARLASFLLVSGRQSDLEIGLRRRDGTTIPVRISHASLADGYSTLLVTDRRPAQWPGLAVEALDSIRSAVEQLDRMPGLEPQARDALASISEQINGLARLIDEMIDVQGPGTTA